MRATRTQSTIDGNRSAVCRLYCTQVAGVHGSAGGTGRRWPGLQRVACGAIGRMGMSGNARSRLGRRLEKLEATIRVRSWDAAEDERRALTKLPPSDRVLLRAQTRGAQPSGSE